MRTRPNPVTVRALMAKRIERRLAKMIARKLAPHGDISVEGKRLVVTLPKLPTS